jgi:hypothetical protein
MSHIAGFVRAQAEKEESTRVIDHLVALAQCQRPSRPGVTAPQPPRPGVGTTVDDPLERLWDWRAAAGTAPRWMTEREHPGCQVQSAAAGGPETRAAAPDDPRAVAQFFLA